MSVKIVTLAYNGRKIPVPQTGVLPYNCAMVIFSTINAGINRCFKNSTQYLVLKSATQSDELYYLVSKHFVEYHTPFAYPRAETNKQQFILDVTKIFEDRTHVKLDTEATQALHTNYVAMHPGIFYNLLIENIIDNSEVSGYLKEMYLNERQHRSGQALLWPKDFISAIDKIITNKKYHHSHLDFVMQLVRDMNPEPHQIINWIKESDDLRLIEKLLQHNETLDLNQHINGKSLLSHAISNQDNQNKLKEKATFLLRSGVAPTVEEIRHIKTLQDEQRKIIDLAVGVACPPNLGFEYFRAYFDGIVATGSWDQKTWYTQLHSELYAANNKPTCWYTFFSKIKQSYTHSFQALCEMTFLNLT